MIPYIFVFTIAIFFTVVGQKIYKNNRVTAWALFIVSILLLSTFSAIRDFSVGTDVKKYGINFYNFSTQYNSLFEYLNVFKSEQLYHMLNYIFSHNFGNIRILFFSMTLFQLIVIYRIILKTNYKSISMGLLVYLLLYFNTSLNILRQTIAIFIILIANEKLKNGKYFNCIFLIFIAYLFHSSAIIMLALIPIYKLSKSTKPYKKLIIISVIVLALFSSISLLLNYSSSLPVFIRKYLGYIRNSQTNLNIKFLIYKVLFLIIFLKNSRDCKNDKVHTQYVFFSVFDVLFYFLSNYINYGYRLSYYFLVFYIFSIPYISSKLKDNKKRQKYNIEMIVFMIGYWIIRYVIIKYDGTIPYKTF